MFESVSMRGISFNCLSIILSLMLSKLCRKLMLFAISFFPFYFLVNLPTNSLACSSCQNSKCLLNLTMTIIAELMSCLLYAIKTKNVFPKVSSIKSDISFCKKY